MKSQLKTCGELYVYPTTATKFHIDAIPVGVGWGSYKDNYSIISVPSESKNDDLTLHHIDRDPPCNNPCLYYSKYSVQINGEHKVYVDYRRCFSGDVRGDISISYDQYGNISTYPPIHNGVVYTFDEQNPDRSCFLIPVTVQTSFGGGKVKINGSEYDSPYTFSWSLSSSFSIEVSPSQCYNNNTYVFNNWSNGGGISHTYTVDGNTSNIVLTANYSLANQLSVNIDGPAQISPGVTYTYSANVSGGGSPYQYSWYNRRDCDKGKSVIEDKVSPKSPPCNVWTGPFSSEQTIQISRDENFSLKVIVTDYCNSTTEDVQSVLVAKGPGKKEAYNLLNPEKEDEIILENTNTSSTTRIYPNPFNPSTTIEYNLKESGIINISIYDITGRIIKILVNGEKAKGTHKIIWDGKDESGNIYSSGIYICRIIGKNLIENHKLFLQK